MTAKISSSDWYGNPGRLTLAVEKFRVGDFEGSYSESERCASGLENVANSQESELEKLETSSHSPGPVLKDDRAAIRDPLNEMATCLWIEAKSAERLQRIEQAKAIYKRIVKYKYARAADLRLEAGFPTWEIDERIKALESFGPDEYTTASEYYGPCELVWDGSDLWAGDNNGVISKIRGSDGTFLGTAKVSQSAHSMAFDGAYIWVSNRADFL